MIVAQGYGLRIREMIADRASQIVRTTGAMKRYTDTQFFADVGIVERGKPYSISTGGEWLAGRNEPSFATCLAMEVVLERPGAAVYIAFACWPAEGAATPGAVRSETETRAKNPLQDPRTKARHRKSVAAEGGKRKR